MTCVVGFAAANNVFLASDSGFSDNSSSTASKSKKIFHKGSYIIGYAGLAGIGQHVCHNFNSVDLSKINNDNFMETEFIPSLRTFLDDTAPSSYSEKMSEENSTDFIVGVNGRLFEITTYDFQCSEYDFSAIGSGSLVAMGYVRAHRDGSSYLSEESSKYWTGLYLKKEDAYEYYRKLAINCVKASCEIDPFCKEPVQFISLNNTKTKTV